jgi:ABC-type Mn2+/Zn2+ transport system permease subunit
MRIPVEFFRTLMLVLIAFTIVISIQSVGVGLVAAMLVTPGATAYLLTRRLPWMMAIAAGIGAAASVVGLYISYYLNIASGSAIVLTATLCFLLAFLFSPGRGFVWQKLR